MLYMYQFYIYVISTMHLTALRALGVTFIRFIEIFKKTLCFPHNLKDNDRGLVEISKTSEITHTLYSVKEVDSGLFLKSKIKKINTVVNHDKTNTFQYIFPIKIIKYKYFTTSSRIKYISYWI